MIRPGDARRRESFSILLSTETARLGIVDPAFDVKKCADTCLERGRVKHHGFRRGEWQKKRLRNLQSS